MDVFKNMLGQIAIKIMPWTVLLGTVFSVAALALSGATGIVKKSMEMFKKSHQKPHPQSGLTLTVLRMLP